MIRSLLILVSLVPSCLLADDLTLAGDARLSGTLRSISGSGAVELESPLSSNPILLKGEAVRKVEFSSSTVPGDIPTNRVKLINGDGFPGVIESFSDKGLATVVPDAGKLEIPRSALLSLELGIENEGRLFTGAGKFPGIKESDSWTQEDGVLTANNSGQISRMMDLPRDFILRFKLTWTHQPDFHITFADPLLPEDENPDCYFLGVTRTGIELRRLSSSGKTSTTLAMLPRKADDYEEMRIELRVDRLRGLIHLFLNEEPEGRFLDAMPVAPNGGGISLVSTISEDSSQEISDLEVLKWNPVNSRDRSEMLPDEEYDHLLTRDGDIWTGRLLAIRPDTAGMVYSFKPQSPDEPVIDFPDTEISRVLFGRKKNEETKEAHPFVLKLRGEGSLSVSSCSFSSDKVVAMHPLLGPLELKRECLAALEQVSVTRKGDKP